MCIFWINILFNTTKYYVTWITFHLLKRPHQLPWQRTHQHHRLLRYIDHSNATIDYCHNHWLELQVGHYHRSVLIRGNAPGCVAKWRDASSYHGLKVRDLYVSDFTAEVRHSPLLFPKYVRKFLLLKNLESVHTRHILDMFRPSMFVIFRSVPYHCIHVFTFHVTVGTEISFIVYDLLYYRSYYYGYYCLRVAPVQRNLVFQVGHMDST